MVVMTSAPLESSAALITGASSGIGEATARRLAAAGSAVALVARRKDRLDRIVGEITTTGGRAVAIEADITEPEQAESAVKRAVAELGSLDIAVNNAGVMLLGPMVDAPLDEWERMVDLNVKGLLYVTKAAMPHLLEAAENGGRRVADLVNISSVAGRTTRVGSGVYNLTKHGVGAFSESLRQEVTRRHVRVSLIEPGATATELGTHLRPEIRAAQLERFQSMEVMQADDIADAIEFVVTRPRHVAINEVLIRPTEQDN
jgi:NADP-dependent 3-hydroxy acid dehydrogenase YdfG